MDPKTTSDVELHKEDGMKGEMVIRQSKQRKGVLLVTHEDDFCDGISA